MQLHPLLPTESSSSSCPSSPVMSLISLLVYSLTDCVVLCLRSSPQPAAATAVFPSGEHLLLHRRHLDARTQSLATHVSLHHGLDSSPPASTFELMTVADDDEAAEGPAVVTRDINNRLMRFSESRVGSMNASSSSAAGLIGSNVCHSVSRHLHEWHSHHHNRKHQQQQHMSHSFTGQKLEHQQLHRPTSSRDPDVDKDDGDDGEEGHDEDDGSVRKIRRNRTVFTELQLMGLERRFDSQKYLSTPDRADLARVLGLTQLQVKTWYQVRHQGHTCSRPYQWVDEMTGLLSLPRFFLFRCHDVFEDVRRI